MEIPDPIKVTQFARRIGIRRNNTLNGTWIRFGCSARVRGDCAPCPTEPSWLRFGLGCVRDECIANPIGVEINAKSHTTPQNQDFYHIPPSNDKSTKGFPALESITLLRRGKNCVFA